MTHIDSIIKQLQQILLVERNNQEEKWKRGECFNIFQILGVATSEVRLHSAFLAELLANGKMLEFIKSQLQRIKDENTFEKMNKLLG
jgi:hypothetical protein